MLNYNDIDFKGGEVTYIEPLGEDMLEVRYKDGYMIDVGYIERKKTYHVTVVKDDDWTNPLKEYKAKTAFRTRQNIIKAIDLVQKIRCP